MEKVDVVARKVSIFQLLSLGAGRGGNMLPRAAHLKMAG